ncbi:MAG TPA: phosphoribosylformylglycinamidine cyclo-ligase [Dehalococcoidales bacterium]|nr:phosphoribosylformylglycinamidine cyclo-ligase [Dehalococcoidales bacterium]
MEKMTYAAAGVNIEAGLKLKKKIAQLAMPTFGPEVLRGIGYFGGFYELSGYRQPVLVSHVDGVGTKMKIALALNKHETIGADIVNHLVNDIFVCGAKPLFFQDYIAQGVLNPDRVETIIKGLASACQEVGCALVGGETPEMPGIYAEDDYDLVGFIVGVVEKDQIKGGDGLKAGDIIIGLPSSGLHTNGYSLVRKVFGTDPKVLNTGYLELGRSLGEALLEPHRCYYSPLKDLLPSIKALAHITGGSFYKNIPRVLPEGLAAQLDSRAWKVPPLFEIIQKAGNIDTNEMYHVFNMGIGMAVICSKVNVDKITRAVPGAVVIGKVIHQPPDARVIIK